LRSGCRQGTQFFAISSGPNLDHFPFPFLEPSRALHATARKHRPAGYSDYASYKPWLRDEHDYRCVYCLTRETWNLSRASPSNGFGADHMLSQINARDKVADYGNLCYCCNDCNSAKGKRSLPQQLIDRPLKEHLRVKDDGTIECLTAEGLWLRDCMHLDLKEQVDWRRTILELQRRAKEDLLAEKCTALTRLFEYPPDLPDLSNLQPDSNTRETGRQESAWARRERGELERFY
jgi:hypothetical protein